MNTNSLTAEREHLANLLEALQRCTHFLHASASKVPWPLDGMTLRQRGPPQATSKPSSGRCVTPLAIEQSLQR